MGVAIDYKASSTDTTIGIVGTLAILSLNNNPLTVRCKTCSSENPCLCVIKVYNFSTLQIQRLNDCIFPIKLNHALSAINLVWIFFFTWRFVHLDIMPGRLITETKDYLQTESQTDSMDKLQLPQFDFHGPGCSLLLNQGNANYLFEMEFNTVI